MGKIDLTGLAAHAVFFDHTLGHIGGSGKVILGARGYITEYDFLCCSSTQKRGDPIEKFCLAQQIAIFGGNLHRIPQSCNAPGND
jgi:hypothetical protein